MLLFSLYLLQWIENSKEEIHYFAKHIMLLTSFSHLQSMEMVLLPSKLVKAHNCEL